MPTNQTQASDPEGNRPFAALRAGLESLTQMGAALAAAQDLSTRLQRFLEILADAAGARRSAIFQAGDAGRFTLLAGQGMSSAEFQAEQQIQESLRAAVQGEAGSSEGPAVVIPLLSSGAAPTVLYLEIPDDEHPVPASAILRDNMGEVVRAAAAMASLALQAEQSRQERLKFVSVVTHELRIPMTSIKGYTDLLRQGLVGPVNADQQNFLNVIRSNVDRMSTLVSDLSDLNRMETGRLRINLAAVDVMGCIREAVDGLKAALDEKGQAITIEAGDLPPARGDQSRVVQIVQSLLNNAHLYSPANNEIKVSARTTGSEVVVAVHDHGAGISAQDRPRIFEPFFRSEDAAIREHPGWGLSLSVARGLLQMMQGHIEFESRPGEGSVFWFSLPLDG